MGFYSVLNTLSVCATRARRLHKKYKQGSGGKVSIGHLRTSNFKMFATALPLFLSIKVLICNVLKLYFDILHFLHFCQKISWLALLLPGLILDLPSTCMGMIQGPFPRGRVFSISPRLSVERVTIDIMVPSAANVTPNTYGKPQAGSNTSDWFASLYTF